MSEKNEQFVITTSYKKKKGLLYHLDKDGDLAESGMCGIIDRNENGKPIFSEPNKVFKLNIKREKGHLYFIKEGSNKNCEIWRVKHTQS